MKEPNRERKSDIKYAVTLNEEQKLAKQLIIDNQIVIVTGRAGSGKSLVCAQAALDFLMKKQCNHIYVTRATIEVGGSLGFLPGDLEEKFKEWKVRDEEIARLMKAPKGPMGTVLNEEELTNLEEGQ